MIFSSICTLFFWLCFYTSQFHCTPQCLDQNGEAVDWYVLYKLPHIKNSTDVKITQGLGYSYITSKTVKDGWRYADHNISDPKSIPGRTLAVAYSRADSNDVNDLFWLLYNDQPPNEPYTEKQGHTKGVVLGDQQGGIWIVHSVPHFPTIDDLGYQYPSTGTKYGQSFLCITLNKDNLDAIGKQLIVNWANIYDYKFESNVAKSYPTLFKAAKMERYNDTVQNKIQFTSVGNVPFTSFAKSQSFGKDLYCKWVAEVLHADLYVETWLHEHTLPTDCSDPFQVHNVEQVFVNASQCRFSSWLDHSKFAVSGPNCDPWVCIGDINRAQEQTIRAGGTVCFQNSDLWSAYHSIVAAFQPCPKK